jgi:DNA-binding GntR family transcriptional regulator
MTDTGDSETAQPKQLRDIAAERLRAMIAQGKLRGGDWLRQAALSAELGISYTPIREALKQLEAEGLVEHVPYRGVRVVQFRPEDILDIYAIRLVLEAQAAASAAQRITDAELEALRQLHDRMCQLHGVESLAEVRALNERFHLKIVEASGRTYLIRTLRAIWTWFPKMLWSQFLPDGDPPEREAQDNAEHAQILAALQARDPEAAERAIRHHIERARQTLIDALAQSAQR